MYFCMILIDNTANFIYEPDFPAFFFIFPPGHTANIYPTD